MQQRHEPRYRQRASRQRRTSTRARRRSVIPGLVLVVAVIGALAIGINAFAARADEPARSKSVTERSTGVTERRAAVPVTETAETRPAKQEPAPPRKHVTFGAHESATQECETCHPDRPTDDIACRSCHEDVCGKDAKTAADCIACHKTGTTDSWVVDQP